MPSKTRPLVVFGKRRLQYASSWTARAFVVPTICIPAGPMAVKVTLGSPRERSLCVGGSEARTNGRTAARTSLVPADANLGEIRSALGRARNKDVTTEKLAGMNHLFQSTSGTGRVDEDGKIEETFNSRALELLTTWVKKRVNVK